MRLLTKFVDAFLWKIVAVAKKRPSDDELFRGYTITNGTTPYLTRVLFPRVFGWRVMLHHIHRTDSDRDMHNHPWDKAFSLILTGSYIEERLVSQLNIPGWPVERGTRLVKWFNSLYKEDFHRISEINGPLWTLFIVGDRTGDGWGFLDETTRKVIPWQEYIVKSGATKT